MKDRDILPCPFCGGQPEVWGSGEGQRGLMIHCIADGCVNPHVSYYEHDLAVRVWNRRVAPSRPDGKGRDLMTPDEFDQKRRELIAMRTKYAGNEAVTNRINNLLGQMLHLISGPHSPRLDAAIARSIAELSQLTVDQ